MDLEGLDRDELADLVHARVQATKGRDVGTVADALLAETAGNPLLADHLLGHWDRSGRLDILDGSVVGSRHRSASTSRPHCGTWCGTASRCSATVPPTTLTAAAVIGLEFNERVLAAMTEVDARRCPRPVFDRAVGGGSARRSPVPRRHGEVHPRPGRPGARGRPGTTGPGPAPRAGLRGDCSPPTRPRRRRPRPSARLPRPGGGPGRRGAPWAIEAGDVALADLAPDEAARWFERVARDAEALGRPGRPPSGPARPPGRGQELSRRPDRPRRHPRGGSARRARRSRPRRWYAPRWPPTGGRSRIGQSGPRSSSTSSRRHSRRATRADAATRAHLMALVAQGLVRTDRGRAPDRARHEALALARSSGDARPSPRGRTRDARALGPGVGLVRADAGEGGDRRRARRRRPEPHLRRELRRVLLCSVRRRGRRRRRRTSIASTRSPPRSADPQMRWAHRRARRVRGDDGGRVHRGRADRGRDRRPRRADRRAGGDRGASPARASLSGPSPVVTPSCSRSSSRASSWRRTAELSFRHRPRHRLLRGRSARGGGRHCSATRCGRERSSSRR